MTTLTITVLALTAFAIGFIIGWGIGYDTGKCFWRRKEGDGENI